MPVLLLARGDANARTLLKQAIEARYGMRPPALDSLQIEFKGRARVKLGPIATWVPVDMIAYFKFPLQMRWDYTVRPVGVPVQRGVEAFDGEHYRRLRGKNEPALIEDQATVESIRRRLWAIAALLLTPLGEQFVELTSIEGNSFSAANTQLGDAVILELREDKTLGVVRVNCSNPETETLEDYTVHLSAEQTPVNELMLPTKIATFWNNKPEYEFEPAKVVINPDLSVGLFALTEEAHQ